MESRYDLRELFLMAQKSSYMSQITQLITRWNEGDKKSLDELISITYQKLHQSAIYALKDMNGDHTLQATELVNELYCHFKKQKTSNFTDSKHFFAIAVFKLRQILQEKLRRKYAKKRNFGVKVDMENADLVVEPQSFFDSVVLTNSLDKLREIDAQAAQLVELRTFWEFSLKETLDILEMSEYVYYNKWACAKAWFLELENLNSIA